MSSNRVVSLISTAKPTMNFSDWYRRSTFLWSPKELSRELVGVCINTSSSYDKP